MSFLSRNKSKTLSSSTHLDKSLGLSTPPREHEEKGGPNGGSIRKRLSSFTLLGTSKRRNASSSSPKPSKSGGVGYTMSATSSLYSRDYSRSPTPEEPEALEIRRPSGLGRRASVMLPDEGNVLDISNATRRPLRRQLSASAPDLSLPLFKWEQVPVVVEDTSSVHSDSTFTTTTQKKSLPQPLDFPSMPPELLKSLFAYTSRRDLVAISLVCRTFVWPARQALYAHLHIQDIKDPKRVEMCMAWLASRQEIANIVRSLSVSIAPDVASTNTFTPTAMVTFAIALTKMVNLESLTLPRFTPHLLQHTTFQLKRFTLLCEDMPLNECRETFSWLSHQPHVISISFPNLVQDNLSQVSDGKPLDNPGLRDPPTDIIPSYGLQSLSHFHGPTSLASIIVPARPIRSLSLTIHTTLYDGLRPSALMASVQQSKTPITSLSVIASGQKKVDARSLERVLMSAGAELGQTLQSLEIEWILEDELLYKQIHTVLPRFTALRSLRLTRRMPPPPPRSPPPSLPLPTAALSTPPPSPSTLFANSKVFVFTPPPSPGSKLLGSSPNRISLDVPLPRAHERSHLIAWSKQCKTLRKVVFLSGAGWRIGTSVGETIGASTFTYVGFNRP
ncbi:hypothetical protein BXZ70DRAFT_983919 [Cristinia sonorae]|uniref:F-box domain-containing protein n=1 Tax=Cristinia sonorae TaxID=1940300 RepID=A0A8K0UV23_9AGAR|nr:hypothetical protein BXZ70DRAFT_983919 [Cristinia sonorae]